MRLQNPVPPHASADFVGVTTYPLVVIGGAVALTAVVVTALTGRIGCGDFPLPPERARLGCVDGLRGYLALAVLVFHAIVWLQWTRLGGNWAPPTVNVLAQLGAGSVGLFFMVTGLVFYPRVLTGLRRTSWPAVYITRVFRIVPLVVVSVLAITAIVAVQPGARFDWRYLGSAAQWVIAWDEPPLLGFGDAGRLNAYVLWSLRFEWLFYLVLLPACALARDLLPARVPTVLLPVAFLLLGLAAGWLRWTPPLVRYAPLFAVGMLAFECQARPAVRRLLSSHFASVAALVALGVAVVTKPALQSTLVIALAGFFFVCVACGNSLFGVLKTRGALVLGEISFGTYLLHGTVLYLVFEVTATLASELEPGIELLLLLPAAGVITTMVAVLAHLYVERPGIRAGRNLAKRWTGRNFLRGSELQVAP